MKRMIGGFSSTAILGLAILAGGAIAALAQDSSAPQARAVRLSEVEGKVNLSQNGQPLADQALANTPLFEGTQIATGDDGRAEVEFEDGAIARIPPDSSMTLAVLRPGETEIDLNSGEGYFELEGANPDQPTRLRFGPNVLSASGFTVVRVQLDQTPGNLAVFSGNAHLEGADNTAIDLHGGESVDLGQYSLSESIEPDSWDAWNSDRDQAISSAEANTTAASSAMPDSSNPAWSDLNNNGSWYNTPDQGYVWSPYDASNPGWDPYGNGYWMNEPSYGYVWVSGYPWGYMPFQCGAWNYYSAFGWGWAPGACSPWWAGGGIWAFNVGAYPRWYRLPFHPRPFGPRTGPTGPHNPLPGHSAAPQAVIAVNRHAVPPAGVTALPARDSRTPVTIGGSAVVPMRLTPSRQALARAAAGPLQYSVHGQPVPARPTYVPPAGAGRATPANGYRGGTYVPYSQPGSRPSQPSTYRPPSYHPPSGGSAPHPSGGGSSHPSGGGGGGGHPAGGGGGGHPGGGSHK